MNGEFAKILAYTVVFTTFNIVVFAIYFVYGWVIYRKKAGKIQRSNLPKEQREFLGKIRFKNVRHIWMKVCGIRIRNFSICYFVLSEIACFFAIYFTHKYVLVCRIVLLIDVLLLIFWAVLLIHFRRKDKTLEIQHRINLEDALQYYDENKQND